MLFSVIPLNKFINCSVLAKKNITALLKVSVLAVSTAFLNLFMLSSSSLAASTANTAYPAIIDWVPSNDPSNICGGYYLQPQFPNEDSTSLEKLPITIDAEKSSTVLGKGSQLTGAVRIVQGKRSLFSEAATIDNATGNIQLTDGAIYREPGILLNGLRADSNTESLNTSIYGASYLLHNYRARGEVAKITRDNEDDTILIDQGTYTQCSPNDETWLLDADSIKLNPNEGFGVAKHATLKIASVPVFYVPYFYFPLDDRRRSGFLYPEIHFSEDSGLDISVPYYFNLAPNYDDTLTTRFIRKRGVLLHNEFRYLNPYSSNQVSMAWMFKDKKTQHKRWMLDIDHSGSSPSGWHSSVDFLAVSDNDYFDSFGDLNSSASDSHLNKRASIVYYAADWNAKLNLQSYQTIDESTKPYRKLPQITVNGSPKFLNNETVKTAYLMDYTRFTRDTQKLKGVNKITGQRIHFEPSISTEFKNSWGYFKPKAKLWTTHYRLKNQPQNWEKSPTTSVPVLSIDSGIYLDRKINFLGKTYLNTLEPRLFGLYVPEKNQKELPIFDSGEYDFSYRSLFYENRFSGSDRIGDTKKIALGVTSRLIDPKGIEAVTASVGQAYYLDDRKVKIGGSSKSNYSSDFSDIAASVNWKPNKRLNINWNANFSHEDLAKTDSNLFARYQEDRNHIISISHRYLSDVRNQSTLSYIWPATNRWSTFGLWQQDWLNKDNVDTAFGVEYESCCMTTRLVARRWLKDNDKKDNAFYLQFVFKGLGSLGSSGDSSFVEKIIGFKAREKYDHTF